ncbi:zinc ribbon domain-containing protein [Sporosarcina obsidiansis]|uniref:zinc ribbon domain-containing protein n=1 Tax=Sporosarcina obsidiansis TaxID=2660748 RepID=UPI00129AF332|nr:zinc ribbon domain-containing protein [Sporosarcina obsidiansis]
MTSFDEQQTAVMEDTENIKCPSCGGNTNFDPATGGLKCPFCSHEIPIEATYEQNIELDFVEAGESLHHLWKEDKRVFSCENCGAQSVLDANVVADFCSFCGSSHIAITKQDAGIQPGLLIPFHISKEEANAKFKEWIKGHFFAPSKLKQSYQLNKISGAYLPYWTYDSHTRSSYVVQVGNYYYVTETRTVYEDGKARQVTEQVRKIRWHRESGNYREFFDDVLVKASTTIEPKLLQKVQPFQLASLTDYKVEYMSGFLAERYSVSLQQGFTEAQNFMKQRIISGIEGSIAGDIVEVVNVSTDYSDITYKHILLPLWISSFQFNQKIYQFLVNGQTGKVTGNYPISIMKVVLVSISVLMILFIVYMFVDS